MPTCRSFDVYLQTNNELHNYFFSDIVKMLQICYFEVFENSRSWPSIVIVSPSRNLWCPKCWKQVLGNFHVCLHAKSQLHLFLRCCKDIASLIFWELCQYLTISNKIVVSIWSKDSCLSTCKKSSVSILPENVPEKWQTCYFG